MAYWLNCARTPLLCLRVQRKYSRHKISAAPVYRLEVAVGMPYHIARARADKPGVQYVFYPDIQPYPLVQETTAHGCIQHAPALGFPLFYHI